MTEEEMYEMYEEQAEGAFMEAQQNYDGSIQFAIDEYGIDQYPDMAFAALEQEVDNLDVSGAVQDCADDEDCYEFLTGIADNTTDGYGVDTSAVQALLDGQLDADQLID